MGNFAQTDSFKERTIQGLDQHLNKFINKYAKYYSELNGSLSDSITWSYILSIDLNSNCFAKIKQMNRVLLVPILDLSIDSLFNKTTSICQIIKYQNDPIKTLEHWYKTGVLDKLEKIYEKNNFELDFSSMYCAQNQNVSTIGGVNSSYLNNCDFTKLIIPFKNDKSMYLCVCSST